MSNIKILHLGSPTSGDKEFYTRWSKIGSVHPSPLETKYDVMVVDFKTAAPKAYFDTYNPKWVVSVTTGHTHLEGIPEKQILSLRGEIDFLNDIHSVSEWCIGAMIYLSRFTGYIKPGRLLKGKKIGIVGHGRIGSQLAKKCSSLGMTFVSWDIKPIETLIGLDELFKTCDYISIHLEENEETKGIIDKNLIDMMKPTAYFLNSARGSIVDEKALYFAARDQKIAGVALDVIHDHSMPWTALRNCFMTPHIGGNTLEDRIKTDEFMVEKVMGHYKQLENRL